MKKIVFIVFVSLLLSSCTVGFITSFKKVDELRGIDFRKYSKEGFLFTPEKYNGEYEPIGILNYEISGSAQYRKLTKSEELSISPNDLDRYTPFIMTLNNKRFMVGEETKGLRWVSEIINVEEAVDSLYSKAKKMGANGIISFSANNQDVLLTKVKVPINKRTIILTGFAIKRK